MTKPKKAIILIAGLGTRLRPLTEKMPKCLVKINGQSILVNALNHLAENGIIETILVVGYLKEKIKKTIGNTWSKMKISYVDNDLYNQTNNSYSLWLAIENLNENVLVLEGDVFFENKLLTNLIQDSRKNLSIVEAYNPNLDGTFVAIDQGQKILQVIHKKDRPTDFTCTDKFKTVNLHKFSRSFLQNHLRPTLKKHIQNQNGTEPIEFILNEIVKNYHNLYAFNVKKEKWFEIDDINDLKKAEAIFK